MDSQWLQREGGEMGQRIHALRSLSLTPPFPWGQWLYARLLEERLPVISGALVEFGVAKGGMSLLLGHIAARAGRRVYSFDSFNGLPDPDPVLENPYFRQGDYSARPDLGDLLERFKALVKHEHLSDVIQPVPGLFEQTFSSVPPLSSIAFAHIDVDLYQSVRCCLDWVWPLLAPGGLLAIDDFFHQSQGPSRAVSEFFRLISQEPLYHISFPYSVVIIKGEAAPPDLRRCIDGNRYTLDFLRRDGVLRAAVAAAANRAAAAGGLPRRAANAGMLHDLLRTDAPDRSGNIYDYWRALEDYWDHIDSPPPANRTTVHI